MVTDCFGARASYFGDAEPVFLQNSFALLKVIIPAAICLLLWRLFVTNRGAAWQNGSILGLDRAATDSPDARLCFSEISTSLLLLYAATAVVTFNAGLLSTMAFESLRHFMHEVLP
jgi:hypothetical protein